MKHSHGNWTCSLLRWRVPLVTQQVNKTMSNPEDTQLKKHWARFIWDRSPGGSSVYGGDWLGTRLGSWDTPGSFRWAGCRWGSMSGRLWSPAGPSDMNAVRNHSLKTDFGWLNDIFKWNYCRATTLQALLINIYILTKDHKLLWKVNKESLLVQTTFFKTTISYYWQKLSFKVHHRWR